MPTGISRTAQTRRSCLSAGQEELIYLLLRWLTGPLLQTMDGVKQRLAALVQQLQLLFDPPHCAC